MSHCYALASHADGPYDAWDELNSTALHRGTTSARELSFALEDAGLYRVRVCGIAVTGLSACGESDGLYYDVTPPTRGELCVHTGTGSWCSTNDETSAPGNNLTAYVGMVNAHSARVSWYGFGDAESRIGGFRWAVGHVAGTADVRWWAHVGWTTSTLLGPVDVTRSVITVECVNSVGLTTNATIDLVVDPTPPVVEAGSMRLLHTWAHHRQIDVTFYTNMSTLAIAVDPSRVSDPESPVTRVQVEVFDVEASLTDGAPLLIETLEVDPTAADVSSIVVASAKAHVRYEAVLRAQNAAGLVSKASVAFFVDTDAPINGVMRVCDASGQQVSAQGRNESIHMCASSFVPPLSGIAFHRVSFYAAAGDGALLHQQLVRPASVMHIAGLNLPCGASVRVVSEALSGAGVAAPPIESTLDILSGCVPPSAGAVGFTSASDGMPAVTAKPFCSVAGQAVYGWWGQFASKTTDFVYSLVAFGTPTFSRVKWVAAGARQLVLLRTSDLMVAPASHMLFARACHAASEASPAAVTPEALSDELCSAVVESAHPLVIVTDKPSPGVVEMATRGTTAKAVLSDHSHLSVRWSGFGDATLVYAALEYEVCVGTTPYGCQLHPFVSVGSNVTWDGRGLDLPCSTTVYVAVRATNCAGLQRTVASSGATLCCDKPTGGMVTIVDSVGTAVSAIGTSSKPLVTWSGFVESCSGVSSYTVALVHSVTSQVVWQSNSTTKLYAALPAVVLGALDHAIEFTASVSAESVAGHVASKSVAFVVDRTPPTLSTPEVRWSLAGDAWQDFAAPVPCLPDDADVVEVRWNITDSESDIATREVALISSTDEEPSWQVVGASAPLRFAKAALPGQYGGATYFVARACNSVELCMTSDVSAGLTQEQRAPSGGAVVLGSADYVSGEQVTASWSEFTLAGCPDVCGTNASHTCFYDSSCLGDTPRLGGDGCDAGGFGTACRYCGFGAHEDCPVDDPTSAVASGTLTYEACVGTTPYGCQLKQFSTTSSSFASSDLPLPCGATIFVAVRATNCAGLQRTVASEGAKVCCQAPAGGMVMLLDVNGAQMHFVGNVSYGKVSWSGFTEACSGVREYVITLAPTSGGGSSVVWNATGLDDSARSVLMPADVIQSLLSDGVEYTIEAHATSHAGLTGSAKTTFMVDRTPPATAPVKLRWSTASPDGVMAHMACITGKVEDVEISWDFWSDASNTLSYSVGVVPLASDDLNGTAMVPTWQPVHPVALISMALPSIFRGKPAAAIAVRACDAVGLCSESDWSHLHLISSSPVAGQVVIEPSWGASNGFLRAAGTELHVQWTQFGWVQTPSFASVRKLSYQVCVGTTPYGCQLKQFSSIGNATSWLASAADVSLPCSSIVHVAVRATNCAGLQRTVASEGAKVCCQAPAGGVVMLLDVNGAQMHFVGNVSYGKVSWSGFTEACSGVREYVITLAPTSGGGSSVVWNATGLDDSARSVLMPADVIQSLLSDGVEYTIEAHATSHAGLTGSAKTTFMVDRTPPAAVAVFNGQLRNVACQQVSKPLRVSWQSITDDESGVASIEWALGTQPLAHDLLAATRIDGDAGELAREWSDMSGMLKPGTIVHSTLTVTNGAGDATVFTPPPVRMVPRNCSSDFFCLPPATTSSGVHPLMLPLVLGLAYDVSGKITAPGFMAQKVKMDLRVHLNEVQRMGNGSRLLRLSIGRESIVRDRHGTPVESLLTEDAFTYPMVYEQDAQGTVVHVLHHPQDTPKSLQLKRMLVSAQQLPRVSSTELRGVENSTSAASTVPLAFSAFEEDHDGPAYVAYEVRKGLMGRVVYQKHSNWQPTKRRPAVIEQRATTRAILNNHGTLLHMRSEVYYSTNVSKQPLADGSGVSNERVEGFDFLPKEPAVYTWSLRGPSSLADAAKPTKRRLTRAQALGLAPVPKATTIDLDGDALSSFVHAKLHLDDAPETVCKLRRRDVNELLNCVFGRVVL